MLLLLIVSICSQYIIQTALFLTISMSFLWGTIGIGISPHSAVPITGMIGFALSIAYAFIVWDRIPLSAANLRTGITGLRHFWSICCVAICVQWMAWAYVVYFLFVVCGVYDWIQEQRAMNPGSSGLVVESSDNTNHGYAWEGVKMTATIERGIYALLAVSFYWTLQVLQVRMGHACRYFSCRLVETDIREQFKQLQLLLFAVGGSHPRRATLYLRLCSERYFTP
jgi:Plasma-membrane choline transporter